MRLLSLGARTCSSLAGFVLLVIWIILPSIAFPAGTEDSIKIQNNHTTVSLVVNLVPHPTNLGYCLEDKIS